MGHLSSGARPQALEHFADRSEAIGMTAAAEVNRLAAALDYFAARCKEYYVLDPADLPSVIRKAERRHNTLARQVRMIAHGFRNADNGGLDSLRNPLPQPSRSLASFMFHAAVKTFESGVDTAAIISSFVDRAQATGAHVWDRTFDAVELSAQTFIDIARELTSLNIYAAQHRFEGLEATLYTWVAQDMEAAAAWVAWNSTGLLLNFSLGVAEFAVQTGGPISEQLLATQVFPTLLVAGFSVVAITTFFGADDWTFSDIAEGDLLALVEMSFWQQVHTIEPELFQQITRRLDNLLATAGVSNPRPLDGPAAEPLRDPLRGVLDVSPYKLFPPGDDYTGGPYQISPGALMDGPHALISPFMGEQVSFARINEGVYVLGIYGLDMKNLSNSPNSLHAVALTASGHDPESNPYYLTVRLQVLDCIKAMPPGSDLHFTGHSMGAGMVFTLLNDPVVLDALRTRDIQVPSVTTLGGVRPLDPLRDEIDPNGPNGAYPDVLTNTVVRHYNDPDDQLANNNGAGHDPARYPTVIEVDDGDFDSPTSAHTTYEHAPFEQLPEDVQFVPWIIDPMFVEKYRVPPPPYVSLPGDIYAGLVA